MMGHGIMTTGQGMDRALLTQDFPSPHQLILDEHGIY
jgi:hypothetical protein